MGKNFHTYFFMYYIVSHTIFVLLSYTQGRLWTTWKKLQCINAMCFYVFCVFFMLLYAMGLHVARFSLSHSHTKPIRSRSTQTQCRNLAHELFTLLLFARKTFSFTFGYFCQFSSVSHTKQFFFGLQSFLRGSNNKHLLLKCINCNKNKNNNKLKQLQRRRKAKRSVIKNSEGKSATN